MKRIELSEEYKKIYEHIELIEPMPEDYAEYRERAHADKPASLEQYIDILSFLVTHVIPKRLDLTESEKSMIMKYHIQKRFERFIDRLK